ncbi:MAG: Kelch repeat-containing protein [Planctomycetota bacterium]|jgi:hypothetical protein
MKKGWIFAPMVLFVLGQLGPGCSKEPYSGVFPRIVKLTVARGAQSHPGGDLSVTATDLAVFQFSLTAGLDEQVFIDSIRFTELGTADAQGGITGLGLYLDMDGDGAYSPMVDGVRLGSRAGGYGADDTVTFSNIRRIIHPGTTETWILTYTLSGTANAGDTFIPSITAAADISAAGGESDRPASIEGVPAIGNTLTVRDMGFLTVALGPNAPPASNLPDPPTGVAMIQLHLVSTLTEDVVISSITFTATGSGDADGDVSSVELYNDQDGSGNVNAGDIVIGAPTTFSGRRATFAGLAETITAGPAFAENWLVVCSFSGGNLGDTYRIDLAANADIAATGVTSLQTILPTGAPVFGNPKMMGSGVAPLFTIADLTPPGGIQINRIESNVVMLQIRLTADPAEGITVQRLTFRASGSGDDSTDISSVCLFLDTAGDGILQGGTDPLLAPHTYGYSYDADDGTVTFSGIDHTVPAGSSEYILLVYYMAGSGVGPNYRARFDPSTDITAMGAISNNPAVFSGASFNGPFVNLQLDPLWTQTFPSVPATYAGEQGHSAIFDGANNRILLFGGVSGLSTDNNAVWEIDLTGATPTWTPLTPAGSPPLARHGHSAVYVPPASGPGGGPKMIVFGGWHGTTPLNDAHLLDLTAGAEAWMPLNPVETPPLPRCYHTAVWDDAARRMVVYGGSADPPSLWGQPSTRTLFNDVWVLDLTLNAWLSVNPSGTPPAGSGRAGHTAVYDAKQRSMIVFAGCDYSSGGNEVYYNDIYALELDTWQWRPLSSAGATPPPRYLHSSLVDEIGRRMFVFAGGTDNPGGGQTLFNDIFVFNLSRRNATGPATPWTALPPVGGPPASRYNLAGAYDFTGHRSFWFTGHNASDGWVYK